MGYDTVIRNIPEQSGQDSRSRIRSFQTDFKLSWVWGSSQRKDASQNGQGEVRLEAIGSHAIILLYFSFCCYLVQRRQTSWEDQRRLSNTNSAAYLTGIQSRIRSKAAKGGGFNSRRVQFEEGTIWIGYGLSRIGLWNQAATLLLLRKHE